MCWHRLTSQNTSWLRRCDCPNGNWQKSNMKTVQLLEFTIDQSNMPSSLRDWQRAAKKTIGKNQIHRRHSWKPPFYRSHTVVSFRDFAPLLESNIGLQARLFQVSTRAIPYRSPNMNRQCLCCGRRNKCICSLLIYAICGVIGWDKNIPTKF